MTRHVVELREPGAPPRRIAIDGSVEFGRGGGDVALSDPALSRRHLVLSDQGGALVVRDLGSRNGTRVNDGVIGAPRPLAPGDVVGLGQVRLVVLAEGGRAPALAAKQTDAATIRFRPGSAGEAASGAVAAAARRARRRLAKLSPAGPPPRPAIALVDPFPDPDRPGELVTEGTVVDATRGEIWMVVTPESPPEALERPLALMIAAGLPAASEVEALAEGYGLHVGDAPDPDETLRRVQLPPLAHADGELRAAMALSFVAYLVERENEAILLELLTTGEPGGVEAAAHRLYGNGLAALEEAWRERLAAGPGDVRAGRFLRLSLRYMRPHVWRQVEMFAYMLLGLAFLVVFPFAFQALLDDAIPSGELSQVITIVGALAIALVISLLAGLRRAYLAAYVSSAIVRDVRIEMFDRLQVLSASWFGRRQQGDVLSRLAADVIQLEQGLSQSLQEGTFQLLSLVVFTVVLFVLDPLLAAIVIVGVPIVALLYRAMAEGARKRSSAVQEETGAVLGVAAENYAAQPVVKAFGLELHEGRRFARASTRLFRKQVRLELYGGLFSLSVNTIITLLRLAVLGVGAWLILEGELTLGALVAFISVMGEVITPVTVLTDIGQQVQASTGALVRIEEVLDAELEVADADGAIDLPPLAHGIELAGVGFAYTADRATLTDLRARIPAGSRVAFVGPTGAGKSSVLSLLVRFYDPDEGAIRFDGTDIGTATLASLRGQLGMVMQDTFLFHGTIRENIAIGHDGATEPEVEAAARAAEVHEFVADLPRGYDTLVGEGGGRLSGGQRQRLALARALLRDPRVLLLDEATSALDPRTERLIAATLERAGEGRTTIAVTHRLTSITGYDQIFVLVDGRIVERGDHAGLVAAGGVYATLWAEQTGGLVAAPEAPFDAADALRRVPLFGGLDDATLARVAAQLEPTDLPRGATLSERSGRLALVRRGTARLLEPDLSGAPAPVAELRAGDVFGVASALGRERGAVLEAIEPLTLLVLDPEVLRGLAAHEPSVAAALHGEGEVAAPAGGRRLARMHTGVHTAVGTGERTFAGDAARPAEARPDTPDLHGPFPTVRL